MAVDHYISIGQNNKLLLYYDYVEYDILPILYIIKYKIN